MASLSSIAKKHLQAAIDEAAETGYPPEDIARSMLSFVIQTWQESRDKQDIVNELTYVLENIDPDTDYTFMRP